MFPQQVTQILSTLKAGGGTGNYPWIKNSSVTVSCHSLLDHSPETGGVTNVFGERV